MALFPVEIGVQPLITSSISPHEEKTPHTPHGLIKFHGAIEYLLGAESTSSQPTQI